MPLGVRVPPSASIDGAIETPAAPGGEGAAPPQHEPAAVATAPAVVAPPPGHPRFPLLDSLRAIAVLCVLITHTSFLSGSNEGTWFGPFAARLDVGVTIFFLLSGFLLYRPFVNVRLNGAPATPVTSFFKRRFLRIFPAYWLALTVLSSAPGLPDVHTERWWVYYGLFQAYDPSWFDKGIGTAWSLSTEVAFYALLPLYAWAMTRLARRRKGIAVDLVLLAALALASVVARALVVGADRGAALGQASTFPITLGGTFLWFALGMGMAIVSAWLAGRRETAPPPRFVAVMARRPWLPWLGAAACFVLVSKGVGITGGTFQRLSVAQVIGEHLLYAGVGLGLMLPAVFGEGAGGWPRRVLANRWLGALGLISYGVFLWHLTIAIKLSGEGLDGFVPLTLVTAAVALPIAALSYVLVERPLLRLKYRRGAG